MFIIKERKRFPLVFLPKYLIGREQKFQHNVSFDWSRNKRKAVDGLFPSVYASDVQHCNYVVVRFQKWIRPK